MGNSLTSSFAFPPSIIPAGPESNRVDDCRELAYGHLGQEKMYLSIVNPNSVQQLTEKVVLYVHGNGESIRTVDAILKLHAKGFGCSFIAFDWAGYGASTGKASEKTLNQCAELALEYLLGELHVKLENVTVWGRSIGTVGATHLAHLQRFSGIRQLILQSPVASAFDVVFENSSSNFMNQLNNKQKVRSVAAKIFLLHGDRDEVVNFRNGEAIFKAIENTQQIEYQRVDGQPRLQCAVSSPRVTFWRFLGGFHNNLDMMYCSELRWCVGKVL